MLITGGAGFLGKHVVDELRLRGGGKEGGELIIPRSYDFDLRDRQACHDLVQGIDVVIHLAANVGGIGYNLQHPAELFLDNLLMGTLLMDEARSAGVAKFVGIGTICSYPKHTPVPFKETTLWEGYPEESNAPYGMAKKMLLVQGQSYREQYGFNSIYLLPTNLYGPGDNFQRESSHVIPALIRKVIEAADTGKAEVQVWGSGSATRDFLYVEDAAKAIVDATELYDEAEPLNLGSGSEISIMQLAHTIVELCGYEGCLTWDRSRPDGQPRRSVDAAAAETAFGFLAPTNFRDGLAKTIDWYRIHQGEID